MNTVEYLKMEGREEERELIVRNLLKQSDFPVEKIASLTNASIELVKEIKKKLKIK